MDTQQLEGFEALQKAIMTAPPAELPDLFAAVAKLQALAFARIASVSAPAPVAEPDKPDRLLSADEAQMRYFPALTVAQFKRRRWPFRRAIGRRSVLYSERALRLYLARASGKPA